MSTSATTPMSVPVGTKNAFMPARRSLVWSAIAVLALAAAPWLGVYPEFLMQALCMALLASAFHLLFGFGGLLSFGHAAFYATAAYTTGHAMKHWGLTPELGIALGTAAAAALGCVFGWLAIRRQGIYFAMVTLALAQMVYFFLVQAPFSGAEDGLQGVPRGRLFGLIDLEQRMALFYVVLAICVLGFCAVHRIVHSPFGHVLRAIRENEARALSLGYKVNRYKLIVFTLSAALAGLAGATKTLVFQLATLGDAHWAISAEVILMTLVGGLGTVVGPILGAFAMVGVDTYFSGLGFSVTLLHGLIFIVCVLAFRRGLWGAVVDRLDRAARRKSATR